VIGNVAIPSTVALLRQARKKVLKEINKKYSLCAEQLGKVYGGDFQGRRATEKELVREVELARAFFSEAKGKYTEGTDQFKSSRSWRDALWRGEGSVIGRP